MIKQAAAVANPTQGITVLVEDAEGLSAKEFEQESKALVEEARSRAWLSHTPQQLAARIPVSVFAMGDL
jgi:hypothetical protein